MEDSPIVGAKGRPTENIGETIKRYLEVNDRSLNVLHDRIFWHRLIDVVDPT